MNRAKNKILPIVIGFIISISINLNAQLPVDSAGWTILTPSWDSRIIYVSNSSGNDANSGLSPAQAKKTIQAGMALLRNRYPDWVLLMRGDTFQTTYLGQTNLNYPGFTLDATAPIERNGRSATEPIVIGTYGDSCLPRPVINTDTMGVAVRFAGDSGQFNLVITGIHFNCSGRNPNHPDYKQFMTNRSVGGLSCAVLCGNILIEDCVFEYFGGGIAVDGDYAKRNGGSMYNFKIRRNIIANQYGKSGGFHSSGLYVSGIDGLLIEENIFDHNGWHDTITGAHATIFNHNMYINENTDTATGIPGTRHVIVRGNIIARASSHGCQLRPGGILDNNLFLQNPIASFCRRDTCHVKNNVVLDSRDINGSPRGWGLNMQPNKYGIMENNIVAHKASNPGYAYNVSNSVPKLHNYTICKQVINPSMVMRNNISYNWNGSGLEISKYYSSNPPGGECVSDWDSVHIENNIFMDTAYSRNVITITNDTVTPDYSFLGNAYYSNRNTAQWFRNNIPYAEYNFNTWIINTNEQNADTNKIKFVDPNRNITTYNLSVGGNATLENFLFEAKKQNKCNWRTEYTAASVNNYIRKGFCKTTDLPKANFSITYNGRQIIISDSSLNTSTYHWDFGDSSSSTQQHPSHNYAANGTYTISLVTTNNCGNDTLSKIVTFSTGIEKISTNSITIYPNPAQDFIYMTFNGIFKTGELTIVNAIGEIVLRKSINGNSTSELNINISELSSGLYIVKLLDEKAIKTGIFIK